MKPTPCSIAGQSPCVGCGLEAISWLRGSLFTNATREPGVNYGSFGIEKRAGGHVFQLNFSNGFGTTMGQLARGGTGSEDWYLGFNISRKFF